MTSSEPPPVSVYCWTCGRETLHDRARVKRSPGDLVRNLLTCTVCGEQQ